MPSKKKQSRSYGIRRRESYSGFHFFNLYQNCPRKFFIKYFGRIIPLFTAPPLIFGGAFHEGKAIFYTTKSARKALAFVKKDIIARKNEYEYKDAFETALERCPILLEHWIDKHGESDLSTYKILEVEKEIILKVPGTEGFVITMRPDAVVQHRKSKEIYIMETKTSSFSVDLTVNGVYLGDQATQYWWGVEEKFGHRVDAVIPDVAYWNKNAKNESNIACVRGDFVFRTQNDIAEYKRGVANVLNEIAQKASAFKTDSYEPTDLFPRNTYYCNAYMKPCEYAEICRGGISLKGRAPYGFKRDTGHRPKITDYIAEDI